MLRALLVAIVPLLQISLARGATTELSEEAINSASISKWSKSNNSDGPDPFVIRVQILLDRASISPGVIDGYLGDNLAKAIRTFESREGLETDGKIDEKFWAALSSDGAPVLQTHQISTKDLSEHYVDKIPKDYAEMAKMKWLGYTGPKEMLAERFHMDQSLLEALNTNADFASAGSKLLVASTGKNVVERASRIVVDRSEGELLAYVDDRLIAAFPATIGSTSNPSPSGIHKIKAIVKDPTYTDNPDKNFQQGDNKDPLEIPPGPNGPVGSIWIDLSEPTYGIHGTSEPDLVDKTKSHGCVRLTNWDAQELAGLVAKGVPVEFRE
jgi:lipoprotein-anchoring transpeptidase ErfK/SrfK